MIERSSAFLVDPAVTESAEQIATAFHEAGHAVMALVVGRPIQRVSIASDELRLGHCELRKGSIRPSQDVLETEILFLLAGLAAQARHAGDYDWDGATQDLRHVRTLTLTRAGNERQAERLERRMLSKVERILERPEVWLAITAIAEELLRNVTISGRAARHLYDEAAAKSGRER
jgi:ATP-dependent Zn protease